MSQHTLFSFNNGLDFSTMLYSAVINNNRMAIVMRRIVALGSHDSDV